MNKFYVLLLGSLLFFSEVSAKSAGFIDGLEDIPLMAGLRQNVEDTVSFGNEEARFIEVSLSSAKAGFKKVEAFYRESLPQLGWTYQGTFDDTAVFYRDSESLSIHKENSKPLKIRITVKNRA